MPSRCCVPLCRGNYPNGPKVSVFGFPKDEIMKKQWLAAIQRKSFIPNTNSKVGSHPVLNISVSFKLAPRIHKGTFIYIYDADLYYIHIYTHLCTIFSSF